MLNFFSNTPFWRPTKSQPGPFGEERTVQYADILGWYQAQLFDMYLEMPQSDLFPHQYGPVARIKPKDEVYLMSKALPDENDFVRGAIPDDVRFLMSGALQIRNDFVRGAIPRTTKYQMTGTLPVECSPPKIPDTEHANRTHTQQRTLRDQPDTAVSEGPSERQSGESSSSGSSSGLWEEVSPGFCVRRERAQEWIGRRDY